MVSDEEMREKRTQDVTQHDAEKPQEMAPSDRVKEVWFIGCHADVYALNSVIIPFLLIKSHQWGREHTQRK